MSNPSRPLKGKQEKSKWNFINGHYSAILEVLYAFSFMSETEKRYER